MTDVTRVGLLLVELPCIWITCRAVGWAAVRVRQPRVIGELIAGFLLGPTVFGALAPAAQAALFPPDTLPYLYGISQCGLVLFMFAVGLEFDVDVLHQQLRRAAVVASAGIAAPFALGGVLALGVFPSHIFFAERATELQAVLFLGAAMAITAFPVLARILAERGISGTAVGSLTLAAGAIDDASAWVILAVVLGSFTGNSTLALVAAAGGVAYVAFAAGVFRPWFRRFAALAEQRNILSIRVLAGTLAALALGAWFTEAIGIYSVFGAFVLGASVPRGFVSRAIHDRIEPTATTLLVPLFFVYSGLHTQLQLLNSPGLWMIAALVFATACVAKGAACWGAARMIGVPPRDALAVAILMNARGMVELILINIGLEHGLITGTMFGVLVLMALGTTLVTGPLVTLVWDGRSASAPALRAMADGRGR